MDALSPYIELEVLHMSQLPFREQLEKHNDPQEVRERLAAGQYGQHSAGIAQEYLASIDRKDAAALASRSEAREIEMLAIAKATAASASVASIAARAAARWAMWAAIIATTAIAIAAKDQIFAFIFRNP